MTRRISLDGAFQDKPLEEVHVSILCSMLSEIESVLSEAPGGQGPIPIGKVVDRGQGVNRLCLREPVRFATASLYIKGNLEALALPAALTFTTYECNRSSRRAGTSSLSDTLVVCIGARCCIQVSAQ